MSTPPKKKAVFASFTVFLVFVATIIIDRLIISNLIPSFNNINLLFPEHSKAIYETTEFKFSSIINSFGIRDHEYELKKSRAYRIVAIGDSFTYGWGVDIDDTWVKIAEKRLREAGIDAEVLNLGRGGGWTFHYAKAAEKAIPLLEPDLVIVAILQGDDFSQMIHLPERAGSSDDEFSKRGFFGTLYPNLSNLRNYLAMSEVHIAPEWRKQVDDEVKKYDSEQYVRFMELEPTVREMLISGNLNPGVMAYALYYPRYFVEFEGFTSPEAQDGIAKMSGHLAKIRRVAQTNKAKVIVFSVPYRAYVCASAVQPLRELGFEIDRATSKSSDPDIPMRTAAIINGLEFFEATSLFRKECRERELYYRYDGHFNNEGNRLFAKRVTEVVVALNRTPPPS